MMEKEAILHKRAEKLALSNKSKTTPSKGDLELVVFLLDSEHYAFESEYIKEIYPLKDHTPLPGVPSFVYGLINIRRRIISVIDIRKLFDMPAEDKITAKAIVLQKEDMEFGVLAEEIVGLRQIEDGELQTNLPSLTGIHQEFLKGITSDRLLVLDAGKLLNSQNVIVNQSIET